MMVPKEQFESVNSKALLCFIPVKKIVALYFL